MRLCLQGWAKGLPGSALEPPCVLSFRWRAHTFRANGIGNLQDGVMNASEQARSVELAQAIASVVSRFRRSFPDARANLTPWRDDPLTRQFAARESLDLSFHFPGWSPRLECRSLLVQLQLEHPPRGAEGGRPRLLGVLLRGLTYESERWRLATVADWQPSGTHLPSPTVVANLQQLCRDLFALFDGENQAVERDDQAA